MTKIICILERIGGISGKRVQIRRIDNLIRYGKFKFDIYDFSKDESCFELNLSNKSDVLKVKDEMIDLDKFMRILQEQEEMFDKKQLDENSQLVVLNYQNGEVISFELRTIKYLFNKLQMDDFGIPLEYYYVSKFEKNVKHAVRYEPNRIIIKLEGEQNSK